jgi:hypothetical protein
MMSRAATFFAIASSKQQAAKMGQEGCSAVFKIGSACDGMEERTTMTAGTRVNSDMWSDYFSESRK